MAVLGNSDLDITPIGIGTWAMGGEGGFGWGPQDDARSIEAIHRAAERGINWLDTAPVYGFGRSERVVGQALQALPREDRPYVFTKCGIVWDDDNNVTHSLKADSVRAEVDASLERLQVDVLDLCQIHWPAFPPDSSDAEIEEGWSTLVDLKAEGKIRYAGVSNFSPAQMDRLRAIAAVTSLQPPYSALMRQVEDEILPYSLDNGIGVLVYSPMHAGMLSGRMTRERIAGMDPGDWRLNMNPAFKEPHLTRNLQFVEVLRDIGERHARSVAEVALAWTLHHPAVTGAIVGARSAEQVDGFAGALEFTLMDGEMAEIAAELPDSIPLAEF